MDNGQHEHALLSQETDRKEYISFIYKRGIFKTNINLIDCYIKKKTERVNSLKATHKVNCQTIKLWRYVTHLKEI